MANINLIKVVYGNYISQLDAISYMNAVDTGFHLGEFLSLYSRYIEERTNKSVLETETGFATYSFPDPTTVYLEDIYILPEYRKKSQASVLADEIADLAKAKGCTKMLGSVVPTANNSTDSLKILIAYGMKLDSCTNNFILLSKGIE